MKPAFSNKVSYFNIKKNPCTNVSPRGSIDLCKNAKKQDGNSCEMYIEKITKI